ncbi:MAG TPA: multiubiquitin domain-containing protein [Gemmatimonadaceae bacterium]
MSADELPEGGRAQAESIDLEEHAKKGLVVPPNATYRIKIDKTAYKVQQQVISGREILALAGKTPDRYRLDEKLHGGKTKKIEPNEEVDLTTPGLEKFMTLPLDQTEGESVALLDPSMATDNLRRHFVLPEEDVEYLDASGWEWETVVLTEGGQRALWLFIRDFPLPAGYTAANTATSLAEATVGIRLTSYPSAGLDMVYLNPPLQRADGRGIGAVSTMQLDGRAFQQWSRHYTPSNQFRVGIDNVSTHVRAIEEWLAREFRR